MTKMHHFDSFFARQEAKKLSIISDRKKQQQSLLGTHRKSITACGLERVCYLLDTRCSSLSLSKSNVLFERDRRNVSSLTNGIDPTHSSDTDTSQIQESMAKKARGLTVNSDLNITSTSFIQNTSGEQLTIAERRTC
jgi:hypothetical protein